MINLLVNESYALDFLSILEIKKEKILYNACKKNINEQININIEQLLQTCEYNEIFEINKKLFKAIADAENDKVKASVVVKLNLRRFEAKKQLQKIYFPESEYLEKKI